MRVMLDKMENLTSSVLVQFDSAGEAVSYAMGTEAGRNMAARMGGEFYSGRHMSDMPRLVTEGDKRAADAAKAMLSKIDAASPPTVKRVRQSRPFGRAVTGAYLASDPMPCRARVKVKEPSAPLSIFVNVTSSAAANAGDLFKRGVAISALVQRIAQHRPVELSLGGAADADASGYPVCWQVSFPTRPIDTYRLALLLSDQGFARGIGFSLCYGRADLYKMAGGYAPDASRSHHLAWAKSQRYTNEAGSGTYGADMAKHLRHELFYIPSAGTEGASYTQMLTDPVAWINTNLSRYTAKAV